MNRIAQRAFEPAVFDRLIRDHEQLTSVLRGVVPPSVLAMFPTPVQGEAGQVQWQTLMAGQPKAFNELADSQAQELSKRLTDRLAVLHQAVSQLQANGSITAIQAKQLQEIVQGVTRDGVISVGDEPLILYWNSALPPDKRSPPLPWTSGAIGASKTTSSDKSVTPSCWPCCFWWLLGLVLLALILAALWWFFCPLSPRHAPSLKQDPSRKLTDSDLTITIPQAKPVDPIELWQQVAIPVAPPKACPEVIPCPEPKICPAPPPVTAPTPTPVKAEPPKPPTQKKPVTVSTAKQFCPGQRPAELAPEIVVVFDNSGSMRLNIATTSAQEQKLMQGNSGNLLLQMLTGLPGNDLLAQLDREPRRITVAKQAVADVVRRLPSDTNAGLVTVGECPRADSRGFFSPGNRSHLLGEIQRLQPAGGTPLADGVLQAGNMVDGVKRESMILVVTDGRESCGGDPCAVAQRLAASKPHLTINVVDIGNSGSGNCLASAARGKVFTARSIDELKVSLQKATQEVRGPANCK